MRSLTNSLLILGFVLSLEVSYAASENDTIIDSRPEKPFTEFTFQDVCKVTGQGCSGNLSEIIKIKGENGKDYSGSLSDYLQHLNDGERFMAKNGYTLRDDESQYSFIKIPVDPKAIREQILSDLRLQGVDLADKLRDALLGEACPSIPAPGVNTEYSPEYYKVIYENRPALDMHGAFTRIAENQGVFCSLGFSLLADVDLNSISSPEEFLAILMSKRDEILKKLGLSSFLSAIGLEQLNEIQDYLAIAQSIDEILRQKKFPSPQQLDDLRKQLNAKLPAELKIPDVPSIPAPVPPTRLDLALKKRKDWSGFNYGDKDRVGTYANAYLEVRGSETEEQVVAFGAAGIYLLARDINVLGGYATLDAGPAGVNGKIKLESFGEDLFPPQEFSHAVSYRHSDPELFEWNFDQAYSQQFAIGPIPVYVSLGGRGYTRLGYEVGLVTTAIYGALIPRVGAEAYAQGAVGLARVLSVGMEANLTILDLAAPLVGEAGIKFDEVGAPFIDMGITSKVAFEALKGRVLAYAEYPVVKVFPPRIKIKKVNKEIFALDGIRQDRTVLNWGIQIGRKGAKGRGELLDMTDVAEANKLDEAIKLSEREQALHDYETKIVNLLNDTMLGIQTEMNSQTSLGVTQKPQELEAYASQFDTNIANFYKDLAERSKDIP